MNRAERAVETFLSIGIGLLLWALMDYFCGDNAGAIGNLVVGVLLVLVGVIIASIFLD